MVGVGEVGLGGLVEQGGMRRLLFCKNGVGLGYGGN